MIYAIHAEGTEFVKVGYTADYLTLVKRIGALQTASPYKLKLLLAIEGERDTEQQLHERIKKHVSPAGNEWFSLHHDMADALGDYGYSVFGLLADEFRQEGALAPMCAHCGKRRVKAGSPFCGSNVCIDARIAKLKKTPQILRKIPETDDAPILLFCHNCNKIKPPEKSLYRFCSDKCTAEFSDKMKANVIRDAPISQIA